MLKISALLGVVMSVGSLFRAFMWAGGWSYLIAAMVLLAAAAAVLFGAQSRFLSAAWGLFIGVYLESLLLAFQSTLADWEHLFSILIMTAAPLGMLGLALSFGNAYPSRLRNE